MANLNEDRGFVKYRGKTYLNSLWHSWVDVHSNGNKKYKPGALFTVKMIALINNLDVINLGAPGCRELYDSEVFEDYERKY